MANCLMSFRFFKDLKEAVVVCPHLKACGIRVEAEESRFINAFVSGPQDSPYAGGELVVGVDVPVRYPFDPPTVISHVTFLSKVWHPNISSRSGTVCVDILKDKWLASMTIKSVLLSVQNLLSNPAPEDPQDRLVGLQMMRDREIWFKTAQHWTAMFANGPTQHASFEAALKSLMEMGFD